MQSRSSESARNWPRLLAGIALLGGLTASGTVMAQGQMRDTQASEGNETLAGDALHFFENNTYLRFGGDYLDYIGTSTDLKVQNATGLAAQAFGPGQSTLEGSGSRLGNKLFPGGTFGMYVPWTNHHLATEVTISGPIVLNFEVSGDAVHSSIAPNALSGNGPSNTIPTGVPSTGRNIGNLKTLPPNISFVYRPFVNTRIQPYIGLGAMYLYTYSTHVNNVFLDGVSEPTLYLSKPVACTGKVGFDINITKKFFVGAEAQYIGCAEVKAKLNNIVVNAPNLSPTFGPVNVGTISSENHFRAVLYQVALGVHF